MSHRSPAYPARSTDAVQLAGGKHVGRRTARAMLLLLLVTPFVLAFAPWQQNLPGEGRVIEFDPIDRPLPIQARTDGVLLKWHVREGQDVKAGDPIVDLADNDPRILERLQDQLAAAVEKRAASQRKRDQYAGRAEQAEQARAAAMRVADDQIRAAEQAVEVARQGLAAAGEGVKLNTFLETMFEGLVQERIAPGFELQRAKQQAGVARAELRAREAGVAAAQAQLQAAKSNRARVENDEQAKVQSALRTATPRAATSPTRTARCCACSATSNASASRACWPPLTASCSGSTPTARAAASSSKARRSPCWCRAPSNAPSSCSSTATT
jgi:pyruvate/2-oxoglutarate dehydrogenase complex dihydrolipoamide acyltransferase (E2) component